MREDRIDQLTGPFDRGLARRAVLGRVVGTVT